MVNTENTLNAKVTSFINRQPTWIVRTMAICALILTFITRGHAELFFIVVALICSFVAVMRSMKASSKDR
jgi:hypothetical protein